jgi:hypothetical protein
VVEATYQRTEARPIETKLSKLKAHLERGETTEALRIAARSKWLGEQKERITRAWAAHMHPETYVAMGYDPAALVAEGIAAIRERYGITEGGNADG